MNIPTMNKTMKEHLVAGLATGVRADGRGLLDFREVKVELNISHSAEGSARVTIGGTEVLAGIKMGVEKPYPDSPAKGNLMVNAELTPMSSPEFETGPPGDQANELARVIDRGIRESKAVIPENLVITEGEHVWSVMLDVVTVNDAGNLADAAGLAGLAALRTAKYPEWDGTKVVYSNKTDKKLELGAEPIPITIIKVGKYLVVDPLPDEEKAADARLTISVLADDTLCAMQKGGVAALSIDEIDTMVGIAIKKAKDLRTKL